jgi:tetratricopeptide (TPR) repeat protein
MMTQKPFKFRYASEIAGSFVLLALALLLAGVVFAAHYQGWFEGTFALRTKFTTEEGSYGLQEGSEIRVRNAVAGKVGKIMPTPDGGMELTFVIQNRFRPFIKKDSVANIKMKFGVAGDAFVEIMMGKGNVVQDGDIIVCKKDEKMDEMIETAKKMMNDVRETLVPMLDEVKGILKHVNGITGGIESGDGIAGSLINDKKMATDLKQTVVRLNSTLSEAQGTLHETTRLIKGAQKSWLIRKYVEQDRKEDIVVPVYLNSEEIASLVERYRGELDSAMVANESPSIVRNIHELGLCLIAQGKHDEAAELLEQARAEKGASTENAIRVSLLESELDRTTGKLDASVESARAAIKLLDRHAEDDLRARCHIALAAAYCDQRKPAEAIAELKEADSLLKKSTSSLKAMSMDLTGRVLMMKGQPEQAAGEFDKEAALLRDNGLFYGMACGLRKAGEAYEQAGKFPTAADRYFKSGRSFCFEGNAKEATETLNRALPAADKAGDKTMRAQIEFLNKQMVKTQ